MGDRFKRLALTFIAKKYVAWVTLCFFCGFGKITGSDLVLITGVIFGLDLWTKVKIPAPNAPAAEN